MVQITEEACDIVGFQEVRKSNNDEGQLIQLSSRLPHLKYGVYAPAHYSGAYQEGLGLLSR